MWLKHQKSEEQVFGEEEKRDYNEYRSTDTWVRCKYNRKRLLTKWQKASRWLPSGYTRMVWQWTQTNPSSFPFTNISPHTLMAQSLTGFIFRIHGTVSRP